MTEYTATTTGTTAKVTATPADETASVVIKKGDTTVTNGGNASFSNGENVLTITVTDGTYPQTVEKVYTVTVTKGS